MVVEITVDGSEPGPPVPDGLVIYATAQTFRTSAYALSREFKHPNGVEVHVLNIPGIVCLAFSAELYLKSALVALRVLANDQLHAAGHNLHELYNRLPTAQQSVLSSRALVSEQVMAATLPEIARTFVTWRYIYENIGSLLDQGFLQRFTDAARSVASDALHLEDRDRPQLR